MNIRLNSLVDVMGNTIEAVNILTEQTRRMRESIKRLKEKFKDHRQIEHDDIEEDSTTELSEDEIFELTGIRPLKPEDRE